MHVLSTPPAFVLSQDQTLRECLLGRKLNRPVRHHESGTSRGIIGRFTASSLCFSKEPRPSRRWRRGINISGVDFWHAVEFSRNGRFLCTHRRDSLSRLSSGRFPLVFPTLSDLSDPISSVLSGLSAFRLCRLYQIPQFPSGSDAQSTGLVLAALGPFRRVRL